MTDEELLDMVPGRVWAAARALAHKLPEADVLAAQVEAGPPVEGGAEAVARAVADAVAHHAAMAREQGWTAQDLDEIRVRRVRLPASASTVRRQLHLLAVLLVLPALPEAAAPTTSLSEAERKVLSKVRALLAKAESTTFTAESEALSGKAQELMARHRVDRAALDGDALGDGPVGRRIWLDDPYASAKGQLLAEVAAANRCQAVQLSGLGCSHVVGFAGDLAVVELLHTSLLVQATRAMAAAGPQADRRGRSRTRSFRQSFLLAFAWRIGGRLREASSTAEREALDVHGAGVLPVLARRDAEVEAAVTAAFPRLAHKRVSVTNAAGWQAGTTAAELADLAVGQELPGR